MDPRRPHDPEPPEADTAPQDAAPADDGGHHEGRRADDGGHQDADAAPGRSYAERRADVRRERVEERILRDKGFAERLGERAAERLERSQKLSYGFFEETGGFARFIGQFLARFWRRPFEGRELIKQMDEVGTKSFMLVSVTGLAIGVVLAMQSRGTLARFGAEAVLPNMLALSVIKEIGPVITSLVLAGRLGAGFAAELGSMKVTEQIDAMEASALKPFHYLVVTRVLACVIMFPLMTILVDTIALIGGYIESNLSTGMDWRVFVDSAFSTLRFSDVIVDTMKTSVFGFIVGIVACYRGYTVRGGTREVGQAAMQAVVLSSLLILVADVVVVRLSLLFFGYGGG
jgi:phospholipid/cholesterol/gamma-HCH transport system permease protein